MIELLEPRERQDGRDVFRVEPNSPISFDISGHGDRYRYIFTAETQCLSGLANAGK